MSAIPEFKIPGYTLIRELGRGGMAIVYLAIQESFGREVALKVLTPDKIALDESFTERFIREAKIVSSLVNPNIVTVYDVGVFEGHHYLSMEYVPGTDLKDAQGKMSRRELLRVIKDVARALDYAGSKGYVHRDVKPENIMIHESDGRVILMDFGIAHGLDTSMDVTRMGKAIGTPYYMSPEQSKGKPVDHRSDIYSLGVVLYQMLTGFVPYDAESPISVGIKHITEPIPILPKRLKMFQPIINTAMSKDPQHRYQTAAELIKALDELDLDELDRIEAEASAFKLAGKDYDASTINGDAVPEIVPLDSDIMHDLPRITPSVVPQSTVQGDASHAPSRRGRWYLVYALLIIVSVVGFLYKAQLVGLWNKYEPRLMALIGGEQTAPQSPTPVTSETKETLTSPLQSDTAVSVVTTPEESLSEETMPSNGAGPVPEPGPGETSLQEEKVGVLWAGLDNQPDNAIELADLYKSMLRENPQHSKAREGIRELRQWYMQGILAAQQDRNTKKMRQLLSMLQNSFPKAGESPKFIELTERLEQLEVIEAHLHQAEEFFAAKVWIQPAGGNALEEWNAVLALEADNPQALAGLNKLVRALHDQAQAYRNAGKYQSALATVRHGLSISANDQKLLSLEKKINANIKTAKKVNKIIKQADSAFKSGHLISPEKQNAYVLYQSVFKLDKNNRKARNGLKQIEKQLISYADEAIAKDELDKAAMTLEAIKQRFNKSKLLASAELRLAEAIEAAQPKVTSIQFSSSELSVLNGTSNEKLRLGRTLYIGFRYKNFEAVTTLLQAVLFDGTGRVQIAQKPVIVSGEAGDHFFDIELPVEGFAEGSYKLELVMGNESLIAESFLVDNRGGN